MPISRAEFPRPQRIGNKDVFIVTNHNDVMLPWAAIRRHLAAPPLLLTLDHHTDMHLAFTQFLCSARGGTNWDRERLLEEANELCRDVDFNDAGSVCDACIRCHRPHFDDAIEGAYLERKLADLSRLAKAFNLTDFPESGYILDIDLDYFHTHQSIKPRDASVFHDLIRRATAVTVAMEPIFVQQERLDTCINSQLLFERIKEHISKAATITGCTKEPNNHA